MKLIIHFQLIRMDKLTQIVFFEKPNVWTTDKKNTKTKTMYYHWGPLQIKKQTRRETQINK